MNDLIEFLTRCNDEDEAVANEATKVTGVDWQAEGPYVNDNYYGDVLHAAWEPVAEHAVIHQPTRVLRECAARRNLIAYYEFACGERGDKMAAAGLLDAMRLAAQSYVDRPGFRDEWRVT